MPLVLVIVITYYKKKNKKITSVQRWMIMLLWGKGDPRIIQRKKKYEWRDARTRVPTSLSFLRGLGDDGPWRPACLCEWIVPGEITTLQNSTAAVSTLLPTKLLLSVQRNIRKKTNENIVQKTKTPKALTRVIYMCLYTLR